MYLTKESTYIFYAGIKFKNFKQLPKIASVFLSLAEVDQYAFLLKIFYFTVWGKVLAPLEQMVHMRQKFHSFACKYERNLERTSNSSQNFCLQGECFGKNYSRKSYYILLPYVLYCICF